MTSALIGLVGGTTWLSTIDYYRYLNEGVAQRLGGLHSARVLLHSVDFGAVVACETAGDLEGERRILVDAANSLQRGGATLLAFCANTAHVHLDALREELQLPVISIVTAIAAELRQASFSRVGVLSTARTRNSGLLGVSLAQEAGCEVLLPDEGQQRAVDQLIREGAAAGNFGPAHARSAWAAVESLRNQGAEAVILGCTELPLALANGTVDIPLIDSTRAHVRAILAAAGY